MVNMQKMEFQICKKENNPKKPHKRKRPKKPIRKFKYNSDGKYANNGVPNMQNSETQNSSTTLMVNMQIMEFQICRIAKPKKRTCGKKT